MDCDLATAVEDAIGRSASLRDLVERIGALKGIVYVTAPVHVSRKSTLAGGFFHRIVSAGETRMLWIALAHESRYSDHSMGILGHELRHALEVLESTETRTEADVDALYNRIGYARSGGIVETDAALAMGQQIERELEAARRTARSSRPSAGVARLPHRVYDRTKDLSVWAALDNSLARIRSMRRECSTVLQVRGTTECRECSPQSRSPVPTV
jgi:hypothetical protein